MQFLLSLEPYLKGNNRSIFCSSLICAAPMRSRIVGTLKSGRVLFEMEDGPKQEDYEP